jgi:hypothetical protein
MLLIDGDSEKRLKILELIQRFGVFVSILSYVGGIGYFCLLPHEEFVHKTYLSENALSPGKYINPFPEAFSFSNKFIFYFQA